MTSNRVKNGGYDGHPGAKALLDVIIDDPLEWYKVPLEIRVEEMKKYHEENKIKDYSYQTKLL